MRLFIAVHLSAQARRHLLDVQEALRGQIGGEISWTAERNLHLTLKFLGEVPDTQVDEVCRALAGISGRGPFAARATGLWWAPPGGPTRVIGGMLGGEQVDSLLWLHDRIEDKCARLCFEREKRRYSPHITLARPRGSRGLGTLLKSACPGQFPGPSFRIERFYLVQSRLHPSGSQYTDLAGFDLRSGDAPDPSLRSG